MVAESLKEENSFLTLDEAIDSDMMMGDIFAEFVPSYDVLEKLSAQGGI